MLPKSFKRDGPRLIVAIAGCGLIHVALAPQQASAQSVVPAVSLGASSAAQQSKELQRGPDLPETRAAPVLPQLVEPQLTLNGKETLFVRSFVLEGPSLVDEAEVHELLAPYENRKLTLAQIYEAADKITTLCRNKGYIVAKVYVPAQDARGGTLKLKLVPGQYGAVSVNNASLVRDDYLRQVIDHALEGSPLIHKDELERALLLIANLPGAGVPRITLAPGQQMGGISDAIFTVPEARRITGYALADNYGPGWTGRNRLSAGADLNSPLGFGDKLSFQGRITDQGLIKLGQLAYSFPLGYDGLRGEISGQHTVYSLGGIYRDVDASGKSDLYTATLSYPLRLLTEDSIYISGSISHRIANDKLLGDSFNDRRIDSGTAAISRNTVGTLPFFDLPLVTNTSLSLTAGYVNFPDVSQREANLEGPDTQGNYARVNLSFNATLALNEQFSLSTTLRAQKSLSGNLDVYEELHVTGVESGVRSFDEGPAGDSAYVVTPELKYALPDIYSYRHSLGLFTDVSGIWIENHSYTVLQNAFTPFYDVGLGYYATYEYAPDRFLMLKGMVAHSYAADDNNSLVRAVDRHTKGLVQVGFTF